GVAEECLVIERNWRDRGDRGAADDVGGVKTPAEPDLEQHDVGRRARETEKGRRGRYLEKGDRRIPIGAFAFFEKRDQRLLVDQPRMQPSEALQNPVAGWRGHSAALRSGRASICGTTGAGGWGLRSRPRIRANVACSSARGTTWSTMPCSSRYSARWNPPGNVSWIVSSMTRAPATPLTAPGSASVMSPTNAQAAEPPPDAGATTTTDQVTPAT